MTEHFHLVLCISEEVNGLSSFVMRHYSLAFQHEAVWLGKLDRRIAPGDVTRLNNQIEQGFPTMLFIVDPYSDNKVKIAYKTALLTVSLRSPKEKELIPTFYRQLKILHRVKTWLKVGYPIEGDFLDNSDLDKAVSEYAEIEKKFREKGPVKMPGYFRFIIEEP